MSKSWRSDNDKFDRNERRQARDRKREQIQPSRNNQRHNRPLEDYDRNEDQAA